MIHEKIKAPISAVTPFIVDYDKKNHTRIGLYMKAFEKIGAKMDISISENSLLFLNSDPFVFNTTLCLYKTPAVYGSMVGRGASNIAAVEDLLKSYFYNKPENVFVINGINIRYRLNSETVEFEVAE